TFADFEQLGLVVRSRRPGKLFGQEPPQRTRPLGQLRPPHPEQLEGRLVKLGVRLLRRYRVGKVLELVHQIEEPVSAAIHSITSRGAEGRPLRGGRVDVGRRKWVIHTPKAPSARGRTLLIFPRRTRKV